MRAPSVTLPAWAAAHADARDALLERALTALFADERFLGAWLGGSDGRGEADALSDIDLFVVVAPPHHETLCARPWRSAGYTTPERLALLERLTSAAPVVVHEMHGNAPEGGTHTNVLYAGGVLLDMTLIPAGVALRPHESRLLFERAPLPVAAPPASEPPEQRLALALQRLALFWIMAIAAARYSHRGWDVACHSMLVALREHVETVRRATGGEAPRFQRHAVAVTLAPTRREQLDAVRALCREMEALIPALAAAGATVPPPPSAQIDRWLALSDPVRSPLRRPLAGLGS